MEVWSEKEENPNRKKIAQIHSCMLFQKKHTENDASN